MRVRMLILSGIILLMQSCYSDKDDNIRSGECSNSVCTEEFRIISVDVRSSEAEPVALDSIKVVISENGADITTQLVRDDFDTYRQSGSYPIFSDLFFSEYKNQELSLNFSGYIDSEEVINETYQVGADCCHVYLISGDTDIVLEQ